MMYDGTSGGALMIQIIIEKCGDSPVFKIPEKKKKKVGFSIGDAIDIEVKNTQDTEKPNNIDQP